MTTTIRTAGGEPADPSDAQLVLLAKGGEIAALGTLLDRHRAALTAVTVGILGPGPDVDDTVQDACVAALCHLDELRDPAAARSRLVAIAANAARARRRRRAELPAGAGDDLVAPRGTADLAASDEADRALETLAVRDWVWAALDRMPEALRVTLVLRHFGNAPSYAAISRLCGVPVGTVRSRLHAGHRRLADALLATAAQAHPDRARARRYAEELGAAMTAFQRTGDTRALNDHLAVDVEYQLFDGVRRRDRARRTTGRHRGRRAHGRRSAAAQPLRPAAALPARPHPAVPARRPDGAPHHLPLRDAPTGRGPRVAPPAATRRGRTRVGFTLSA